MFGKCGDELHEVLIKDVGKWAVVTADLVRPPQGLSVGQWRRSKASGRASLMSSSPQSGRKVESKSQTFICMCCVHFAGWTEFERIFFFSSNCFVFSIFMGLIPEQYFDGWRWSLGTFVSTFIPINISVKTRRAEMRFDKKIWIKNNTVFLKLT